MCYNFACEERCQSGRMRRTRNPLYNLLYQGFNSLPLRQKTHYVKCVFYFSSISNVLKSNSSLSKNSDIDIPNSLIINAIFLKFGV